MLLGRSLRNSQQPQIPGPPNLALSRVLGGSPLEPAKYWERQSNRSSRSITSHPFLGALTPSPPRRQAPSQRWSPLHSMPAQEDADVPRHAAGKVDHLKMGLVAARAQVFVPKLVHILGDPGESVLPVWLS